MLLYCFQFPTSGNKKQLGVTRKKDLAVTKTKKIDIPKDFIKKIKKLGMNVDDAEILFKSKMDWTKSTTETLQ